MTVYLVGPGGTVDVSDRPERELGKVEVTNPPSGDVDVIDRPGRELGHADVFDRFTGGEPLDDQAGAGAALEFTFAAPVDLIWVRCDGGDGRANPFGGIPDVDSGIFCEDGIPNPITMTATVVRVFAAIGTTVRVWGYRYE